MTSTPALPPAPPPPPSRARPPAAPAVRWGMGDAVLGWVVANAAAAVIGAIVLSATGHAGDSTATLPLALLAVLQIPLWLGYAGVPVWAARTKGRGVVQDFRLRLQGVDVPVGIVVGLLSQFLLVPLLSLPMLHLLDKSTKDLNSVAKSLTDRATDPLGVVLLILVVAIAAPIVEELFFRGLVLRSIEKRLGPAWGIGLSGLVFGATHFELLQLPALAGFGMVLAYLAWRTDRLGPGIVAHMTFNTLAVVSLLATR